MKETKEIKTYIVIKEGILGSIITDFVSFGVLAGTLYLNYRYLGNQSVVTWFLLIIWLLTSYAKGTKVYNTFRSTKEAIKFLEDL